MRLTTLVFVCALGCGIAPLPEPEPQPEPEPTRPICGDALQDAGEACDDGNVTTLDGCSEACQVEPGHAWESAPDGQGGVPDLLSLSDLPLVIHATSSREAPDSFFISDLDFDFVNGAVDVVVTDAEGGCLVDVTQLSLQDGAGFLSGATSARSGECARLTDVVVFEGQWNRLEVAVAGSGTPYLVVITL